MLESVHAYVSQESRWLLPLFFTVLATVTAGALLRHLLNLLERRLEKTRTVWDDAALDAVHKPMLALIWVLGLNMAANIVASRADAPLFEYADEVREVAVILIVGWFLARFVQEAEARLVSPVAGVPRVDVTTSRAVAKLLRLAIIITTGLVLLQKLGYSIAGVLAFGGVGGIIIGLAAKDLLANFFGGLMIYLDRPFSIGEWVRSPDRNIEGTVEAIGWRLTRIRTFDKRPLYVPNSTFASIAVENPSRMTHRRINETIGVRYDDWQKLPGIVARVKEMLLAHPGIAQDQTLIVNFDSYNASSLDFFIYTFTRTRDWVEYHAVKQDVLFRIMEIIAEAGAEVAFPTRTLHIASPAPEAAAAPFLELRQPEQA